MKRALHRQDGQVTILAVFTLLLLCGVVGMALDTSVILNQKRLIQNAVDLTALAAAQEAGTSHGAVQATAIDMARKNGLRTNEISITHPYDGDDHKVELRATRDVPLAFMRLFGFSDTEIFVRAVAQMRTATGSAMTDEALKYTVFHGNISSQLDIHGNASQVIGNVHSNENVDIHGKGHLIDGNLSAGNDVKGEGDDTITGTITEKGPVIPMPNLDFNGFVSQADYVFNTSQTFNNMVINGIYYVNGDVVINGGRVTGKGMILASGNIKIATSGIEYSNATSLLALYSLGNIQIASANSTIKGVLYAPNGQIQISGSGNTFYGALIADEVWWATKDIIINGTYDIRTPQALDVPLRQTSLIE